MLRTRLIAGRTSGLILSAVFASIVTLASQVEVVLEPSGKPTIALHNRAAEIAGQLGVDRVHISISHTDELATASAIAES